MRYLNLLSHFLTEVPALFANRCQPLSILLGIATVAEFYHDDVPTIPLHPIDGLPYAEAVSVEVVELGIRVAEVDIVMLVPHGYLVYGWPAHFHLPPARDPWLVFVRHRISRSFCGGGARPGRGERTEWDNELYGCQ